MSEVSIKYTTYKVGQDNIQKWGFDIHHPVFPVSAGLILVFLGALLIVDPKVAQTALDGLRSSVIETFDSYFMWTANIIVLFVIALVFTPLGSIRLGGKNAQPEHSIVSWLAMLFAAGMGIGLLFWGVAEPTAYYTDWWGTPLDVKPETARAERLAMSATIFHWGLHGWGIYALMALSLAFFTFNKGLPLSIRSVFFPLFGDRVWGWLGHTIDIIAVLATLFGLATSLGLGAQQATSGINYLFGTHGEFGMQLAVIVFVTSIAIISVIRGIDGGVKVLSNINMAIAFSLLIFIMVIAFPIVQKYVPMAFMSYFKNIMELSIPNGREDTQWMHGWTVFYWAWWISWSPFVGMFIARVSKGRTIRVFLLAVVLVPTLVTLVCMATFGGIAIDQVARHVGELGENGLTDISLTLFHVYDNLPLGTLISYVSIVLVLIFFITSSDSGSLVIDSITAGGKLDAPVPQRIFWASVEGLVAAVLLWVGGTEALKALQSGVVLTALPFSIIMLLMCVSLTKGLRSEYKHINMR